MRVIVFCPTINSSANPIYESLKHLDENDIILDYSDDKLLYKSQEIEQEKEDIQTYKKYSTAWKKYMKIDEDMSLLSHDELLILSNMTLEIQMIYHIHHINIQELIFLYLMI